MNEIVDAIKQLAERMRHLETAEYQGYVGLHATAFVAGLNNAAILSGATVTTADLRGSYGVPAYARMVGLVLGGRTATTLVGSRLAVDSASETPDAYSAGVPPQVVLVYNEVFVLVPLSTGGQITVKALGDNWSAVYARVVGYM